MKAMKEMYPDVVEDMPPNSPPPWGNPVEINVFVDSEHVRDKVTRRLQYWIIIILEQLTHYLVL